MISTEVTNARLVRVRGKKPVDDWEAPAAAAAAKWEGRGGAGVLFDESRQRAITGSGPTTHVFRTLQVREELGVDWQIGDVLEFATDDGAELNGVVTAVEDPHTPRGQAGEIRLSLDLQA